jgi:hypothetical protein
MGMTDMPDQGAPAPAGAKSVRAIAAITAAVIAALTVSLAVDAFWLHDRIFNTDSFVEALAPLPRDPAVSTAVATRTVEAISDAGNAEAKVADVLPDRLAFLAPDFTGLIEDRVFGITMDLVESDAFSAAWVTGLTAVHSVIIGILEGDPAHPATGDVGIDLQGASSLILDELEARGIDLFSEIELSLSRITFVQAEVLAGPRSLLSVFDAGVWLLPFIALVLVGIAVAIDRDRLRPLQIFGFGSAIAILVNLAIVRGISNLIVGGIEPDVRRDAAAAVWDALLSGYGLIGLVVAAVAGAVGLGSWWYRRSAAQAAPVSAEAPG